ncbi:MAG TPA: GNAT family N-acetyltransferase [Methanobacteriaceae archaeon]|nr:GNAT family N-acetyltransferase [Methanobacteriaceae archaeon]
MLYREITLNDLKDVSELYLKLAQHVKTSSQDPYFNFNDESSEFNEEFVDNSSEFKDKSLNEIITGLNDDLEKSDEVTYVAETVSGKIVGFISGEIINCYLPISKVNKVGYIKSAYTLPEYRNKGIMKALEKHILEFFTDNGVSFVELHVMLKNSTAVDFWENQGYKTFRVHMRKKI